MNPRLETPRFKMSEKKILNFFGTVLLSLVSLIIIIPFYYLIVSSFKDLGQMASTDPGTMWWPNPLHPENYATAAVQYPILSNIFNSVWLGVVQTTLSVFSSCIIAYGFARFKFPGRDILFVLLLATMMLPTQITQIPLYNLFRDLGWTGSYLPLIVPRIFGDAWSIFLLRQMFMNIPKEIDEAAWIDGAGTTRTLFRIILPQAKPALVVACLFAFLGSWKDLFGPLLYLTSGDSSSYTIPMGLLWFDGDKEKQTTIQLAAISIALIPTILLYIFGQRYFERGINVSDLK